MPFPNTQRIRRAPAGNIGYACGLERVYRTKVTLGRSSVNQIEVRDGLQPGDRVILSDMSAYDQFDRLKVK